MRGKASERLVSVQILRGIAALLVLAIHVNDVVHDYIETPGHRSQIANFAQWHQFGAIGVDIFFVISGFVMALTMARYRDRPGAFIVQRYLRIAPLAYFIAASWMLVLVVIGQPFSAASILSVITLVPVLPTYTRPVLDAMWTLSFEFVLYFIVCAVLAVRLGPRTLLGVLMVLASIGLFIEPSIALLRWFTHPILYEFALGVAAFLIFKSRMVPRGVTIVTAAAGGGLLIGQALFGPGIPADPALLIGGRTAIPRVIQWAIPVFLVFNLLVLWRPGTNGLTRIAQRIGDASYSIYLTHLPLLILWAPALHIQPDLAWLLLVAVCIQVGVVTHHYIEKPLLRRFAGRETRPQRDADEFPDPQPLGEEV